MPPEKMKTKLLTSAVALFLLLQLTAAVKIGISKVNIETTSTTTTPTTSTQIPANVTQAATTATAATTEEIFTTSDLTDIEIESTSPVTTTTTTAKTTTTIVKPNFTISIFPPRLRTTKMPKITTTTTGVTTAIPPSTTTTGTPLNATDNVISIDGVMLSTKSTSHSGFYYCACDLLLEACDINCCCDRDCIPEALHVFNCDTGAVQTKLKNRLEDFQYEHGLPSCKVNNGWLCVFRTNLQRENQRAPKIDWDTNHYYKWSEPVWNTESDQHNNENSEHYKYGEALQFLNMKTMLISEWDLPHSFKPPHCQTKQHVTFLKSYKTSCLLESTEEMQWNAQNLLKFIQNNQLILKPLKQVSELEHIKPISSDLQIKICQEQLCEAATLKNSTALGFRLKAYYATDIKLILLHNYTQLLGGMVELTESTAYSPHNNTELWQQFEVEYIHKNITLNEASEKINATAFTQENMKKLTSGALGYAAGEPIIIARFIANDNDSNSLSNTNQVLDYFHANSTKSEHNHTLNLFTIRGGYCKHDVGLKNSINYGINTQKQCKLRYSEMSMEKLPEKQRNYTDICMKLQKKINAQLFGTNKNIFFDSKFPDIYISQLGRPANLSAKWTQLLIRRNHDFAPISGEFNAQTHSFSCRNMLLNIAYEFLVGQFTESGIEHQALVKQATLIFGKRNDLEFDKDEVIEVPLMVTVMFYDYAKDVNNGGGRWKNAQTFWVFILFGFICTDAIF